MPETFFSCPFCRVIQQKTADTRVVSVDGVRRLACGSHFVPATEVVAPPRAGTNGHAGNGELKQ